MQDCYMPDGTVRIREEIVNYRYVRWQIYEISHALDCMNEEEMRKVMKYIMRMTNNRFTFDVRTKKQRERDGRKFFKKIAAERKALE